MTKPQKLKGGRLLYRRTVNGLRISFTSDKPLGKWDIEEMFQKALSEKRKQVPNTGGDATFGDAARTFANSVEGVLSPSTVREYNRIRKLIEKNYTAFNSTRIKSMTTQTIQDVVTAYANSTSPSANKPVEKRSAKTVRNFVGFLESVFKKTDTNIDFSKLTVPAKAAFQEPFIPSDDQVSQILAFMKSDPHYRMYYVPVCLATLGLRRSEICALDISDLSDDNILSIHRARVQDSKNRWITKDSTKTAASTRQIKIPPDLAEAIRSNGTICDSEPYNLTRALYRVQDRLGMPRFSIHKLRHYYASSSALLGIPAPFVARSGGWRPGSPVMTRTYTHAKREFQEEMDDLMTEHMQKLMRRDDDPESENQVSK